MCLDLEDSVAPAHKDEARANAMEFLSRLGESEAPPDADVEVILRINPAASADGERDLQALSEGTARPDAVMVPKVAGPEGVREVAALLARPAADLGSDGGPVLMPLIETAPGLQAVEEVAASTPQVTAIVFGGIDLATELGCSTDWEALLYARSRVVHAAALAGVAAIDMPFLDVRDADGLQREALAARRLGFAGKLVIHPTQVPVVQRAFTPTEQEIEHARRVVEAARTDDSLGVFLLDGKMVDAPVLRAAERTLARSIRPGDRGEAAAAAPTAETGGPG